MQRRQFISGSLARLCLTKSTFPLAKTISKPALESSFTSPWMANDIAISSSGASFISLPRFKGHFDSPGVVQITLKGPVAFPGNQWNQWHAEDDGTNTLVNINACHIFNDELVWGVGQGKPQGDKPKVGAAKLVAFDIDSCEAKNIIRFDDNSLPEGGSLNDLSIHGELVYVTDSGSGGIIIHNLKNSHTIRRLSASVQLRKPYD